MTDEHVQARLDRLHDLAEQSEALPVYREARAIIDKLLAELASYREGMGAEEGETETVLADALHALQACVRHIERSGDNPDCLREARAILEDARGESV